MTDYHGTAPSFSGSNSLLHQLLSGRLFGGIFAVMAAIVAFWFYGRIEDLLLVFFVLVNLLLAIWRYYLPAHGDAGLPHSPGDSRTGDKETFLYYTLAGVVWGGSAFITGLSGVMDQGITLCSVILILVVLVAMDIAAGPWSFLVFAATVQMPLIFWLLPDIRYDYRPLFALGLVITLVGVFRSWRAHLSGSFFREKLASTAGDDERVKVLELTLKEKEQEWERELEERTLALTMETERLRQELSGHTRHEEDLQAAKEEAEEANRAKSDFLAMMSHELRTPMSGITGMADLLKATDLSAEQQTYVQVINSSAQLLKLLVSDILDYSRIEAGKVELDEVDFSPKDVCDEVLSVITGDAAAKALTIYAEYASDIPKRIKGDSMRLKQVLLNLLTNAVKFTAEGGVTLAVRPLDIHGGQVILRFEVRDTGIGISRMDQERLFDKYEQATSATSRTHGGSGLGLAICKGLVEVMGGHIEVESLVGEGSTFWFTARFGLVEEASGRRAVPAIALDDDNRSLKILLVEDKPVNQTVVKALVEKLGHTIDVAPTGDIGVRMAARGIYNMVMMDVMMPGMDGYEATGRIRALPNESGTVPIVAVTANATSRDRGRCLEAGMDDYIAKPVTKDDIASMIEKWGNKRSPRKTAADDAEG